MNLVSKKLFMLALVFVWHAAAFAIIYWKYKDCKKNPREYDVIPNYQEYCRSVWFYNPKKSYGVGTRVHYASPAIVPVFVLWLWIVLSTYFLIYLVMRTDMTFFVSTNGYIVILLYSTIILPYVLNNLWAMHSRRPKVICYVQAYMCRRKRRSVVFQENCIFAMIGIVIVLLFRLCVLSEFGYVEDHTLVVIPRFSLTEQVYDLDDLASIEKEYDSEGYYKHYYIVNKDMQKYDVGHVDIALYNSEKPRLLRVVEEIAEN